MSRAILSRRKTGKTALLQTFVQHCCFIQERGRDSFLLRDCKERSSMDYAAFCSDFFLEFILQYTAFKTRKPRVYRTFRTVDFETVCGHCIASEKLDFLLSEDSARRYARYENGEKRTGFGTPFGSFHIRLAWERGRIYLADRGRVPISQQQHLSGIRRLYKSPMKKSGVRILENGGVQERAPAGVRQLGRLADERPERLAGKVPAGFIWRTCPSTRSWRWRSSIPNIFALARHRGDRFFHCPAERGQSFLRQPPCSSRPARTSVWTRRRAF